MEPASAAFRESAAKYILQDIVHIAAFEMIFMEASIRSGITVSTAARSVSIAICSTAACTAIKNCMAKLII